MIFFTRKKFLGLLWLVKRFFGKLGKVLYTYFEVPHRYPFDHFVCGVVMYHLYKDLITSEANLLFD